MELRRLIQRRSAHASAINLSRHLVLPPCCNCVSVCLPACLLTNGNSGSFSTLTLSHRLASSLG